MPPAEAKSAWRSAVRRTRLQRGERRIGEHADSFRDQVLALPEMQGIRCASIYASRAFEPGTLPLVLALHARGVEVLMPRLGEGLARGWGAFTSAEDVTERAPGRPPEPSGAFLPSARLADADVVIVPALGVDTLGTRLGQGGGWYDRALADARPGVPLIALVFDDEFHDAATRALPREWHDVPVTIAVTPSTVARIGA
jgi:5-formyltetrahydrofolate cyclo-ligase